MAARIGKEKVGLRGTSCTVRRSDTWAADHERPLPVRAFFFVCFGTTRKSDVKSSFARFSWGVDVAISTGGLMTTGFGGRGWRPMHQVVVHLGDCLSPEDGVLEVVSWGGKPGRPVRSHQVRCGLEMLIPP
jgi:hypothetical protein